MGQERDRAAGGTIEIMCGAPEDWISRRVEAGRSLPGGLYGRIPGTFGPRNRAVSPPCSAIQRVPEESVQDGVAEGGIADDIVPVFDGHLAGEQGATAGIAVVEDFEEVVSSLA